MGSMLRQMVAGEKQMSALTQWSVRPCARLAPFIDRLWGCRSAQPLSLPPLLPGTGCELLLHLAMPPRLTDGSALPHSYLMSPRRHSLTLMSGPKLEVIAVRFKSGQLRHFTPRSFAELNDQFTPWQQLWGVEVERLILQLQLAADVEQQVALLQQFLLARLEQHHIADPAEDALIQRLYYAPTLSIEELARWSGWSRRQLERRFQNAFAITPKHFARLARLQHALRSMVLTPQQNLLEIALCHGFWDQSHLIHECQALAGRSPLALRRQLQQGLHYYHPPSRQPQYPGTE